MMDSRAGQLRIVITDRARSKNFKGQQMKVWIAKWDVGMTESGVEVFANEALAIDAAVGYADEMALLTPATMTEVAAREQLLESGSIAFESEQCYYGVEEHEVQGWPQRI